MNVKELITALSKLEGQQREVCIFHDDEIYFIDEIDNSISDRVDINVKQD